MQAIAKRPLAKLSSFQAVVPAFAFSSWITLAANAAFVSSNWATSKANPLMKRRKPIKWFSVVISTPEALRPDRYVAQRD